MVNIRQQILNAKDVRSEQVTIPEWGDVTVEVRGFTLGERLAFFKRVTVGDKVDRDSYLPELIISSCYDPDTGLKVFEDADRDMLKTKAVTATERITDAANRLSALTEVESDTAEKDLDETLTDSST